MSRDDMVIRPRVDAQPGASAPTRARQERVFDRERRPGGIVPRMLRHALGSRLALGAASGLGRFAVSFGRAAAPRVLLANPIGLLVGALVTATVVATRLVSGRSFEGIGQEINNVILGDLDETALASRDAREELLGNPNVARIIGQEGRVNAQIGALHKRLAEIRKRDRVGRTLFMSDPEFDVNNTLDILILRGRDKLLEAWHGSGGPGSVDRVREKLEAVRGPMCGQDGGAR